MSQSSNVRFFDTHCHLHESVFDNDREKIIEKMRDLDIESFLTIGTSYEDSLKALKLRDQYPDMCKVAMAIDPTSSAKYDGNLSKAEKDFEKVAELARKNAVTAIGETGLDRFWRVGAEFSEQFGEESFPVQQLLFERHLELATELNLPIIIHERDALKHVIEILNKHAFTGTVEKPVGVFHCFTRGYEDALKITKLGFLLGIGGIVTFKNASKLQEAVKKIDPRNIVFETDAPYLTPEPYRGQRNDPTFIPVIAEFVEGLRGEQISNQIWESSTQLLK